MEEETPNNNNGVSVTTNSRKTFLRFTRQNHNRVYHPIAITNQKQSYQIRSHIGDSFGTIEIPVYKIVDDNNRLFFSLKLVNAILLQPLNKLLQETDTNAIIPNHENVMGIDQKYDYGHYFCVLFPSMSLGSIRFITDTQCRDGLPEEFIVIVLKETLQGLSHIHDHGQFHKQINAGHIYMNSRGEIKIGFSATVYEEEWILNQPSTSSSILPMIDICNWGSAPEVYHSRNAVYNAKSDIWLIGITALELALGNRLKVLSREGLENGAREINETRRLPLKQEQGSRSIERKFSKKFQRMVAKCFAFDPGNRPTAAELLQSSVFKKSKEVLYFYETVMENMSTSDEEY